MQWSVCWNADSRLHLRPTEPESLAVGAQKSAFQPVPRGTLMRPEVWYR